MNPEPRNSESRRIEELKKFFVEYDSSVVHPPAPDPETKTALAKLFAFAREKRKEAKKNETTHIP
jgi:hypothetical protein